jgi:flavin reductase (DIM6/NTAB) family NADH-FMN oxidoreductase RutF
MQLDPETLAVRDRYLLMIATILPRPIAWVATVSPDGKPNLAPFSFFTGICANPMTVCFAPVNDRNGKKKDTLINIEATGQFTVNIVNEQNAEKMNQTSAPYAYGVNEFEKCGVTAIPSAKIKPPRVKESPAAYECELQQIVRIGDGPLAGNLVIGRVVMFHCADAIYNNGKIKHQDIHAIGRMEGAWYSRTNDSFELPRPEAV